jgi:spermidine synthase
MTGKKRFIVSLVVMGASGIIAQIVLLRELLINFYGNELSIGIILANWLILESIGAFFLGKQIERSKARIELFIIVTLLFSIFFPGMVYISRIIKGLLTGSHGETAGISLIFFSSLLVFLPVSLTHGALFTFGCKIISPRSGIDSGNSASTIGKVYVYETIGAILGGACLTFLLVPYFGSFQIAFALAILNLALCVAIGAGLWKGCFSRARRLIIACSVSLAVIYSLILCSPMADKIHMQSLESRWRGQDIIYYKNSIYGNIAAVENQGQYTFYSDGVPVITVPTPDIASTEEFVHLTMLSHPDPKDILIISGGAGGVIHEILKYDIHKIDYVELDPLILKAVKKFPTGITVNELSSERVNVKHIDGKMFVKTMPYKYDVIFIGLDNPASLSVNRLFTKEFFSGLADRLNINGIIAFQLPGSSTYLGNGMKKLNACILNTLNKSFQYTKVLPGDTANIYMGSSSEQLIRADQHTLVKRFKLRHIDTLMVNPFYIEYRLQRQWTDWFKDNLKNSTNQLNRDFRPIATFFSLWHWNTMLSPYTVNLFKACEKLTLNFFLFVFVFSGMALTVILLVSKQPLKISVPVSIATTGFSGMLFDLIIIFAFQIIYGYVFYWLGFLVSLFMAGALAGSFWMINKMGKIKNTLLFFLRTEAAIIIFALLLAFIINACGYLGSAGMFSINFKIVFVAISLVSGFVVGVQFPLANKIYLSQKQSDITSSAGTLYSCDLLGGWASGIISGVVLLPVLGVFNSCLVVVLLKSVTFACFAVSMPKNITIR